MENTGGALSYTGAGWAQTTEANASGGNDHRTGTATQYADFSFTGNAVSITFGKLTNGGKIQVILDPAGANTVLGEFDQCGASASWQNIKTYTGFTQGAHVIRLKAVASDCNGSSAASWNVDAVRAYTEQKAYQYDNDNRLKQVAEGGTTTTFQYDQNGSTTKKTVGANVTTYTWDGASRLKDVSLNGASQAAFAYDGNGARKTKTAGGVTTTYINDTRDLTRVLQETKSGNTLTYIPGLTQHDPSQSAEADRWSYFHTDAMSTRALTNNSAAVTKLLEYDPFGTIRTSSGAASTDFGFTEEQRDTETGLINLRARYYDPVLGRLMSRDPLEGRVGFPQTLNRYQYALNNPLRFVDPSGYEEVGPISIEDPGDWSGNDCGCSPNDSSEGNFGPDGVNMNSPTSAAGLIDENGTSSIEILSHQSYGAPVDTQEATANTLNTTPGLGKEGWPDDSTLLAWAPNADSIFFEIDVIPSALPSVAWRPFEPDEPEGGKPNLGPYDELQKLINLGLFDPTAPRPFEAAPTLDHKLRDHLRGSAPTNKSFFDSRPNVPELLSQLNDKILNRTGDVNIDYAISPGSATLSWDTGKFQGYTPAEFRGQSLKERATDWVTAIAGNDGIWNLFPGTVLE